MDLKDIFFPLPLEESQKRVDKNGEFKELKALIARQCSLYPQKEQDIKRFWGEKGVEESTPLKYHSWPAYEKQKKINAFRQWQADLVELIDFL